MMSALCRAPCEAVLGDAQHEEVSLHGWGNGVDDESHPHQMLETSN